MGAVRPIDHGVLEEQFVVRLQIGFIVRVLRTEASKLRRVELKQCRLGTRRMSELVEQTAREQCSRILRSELCVAKTEAPLRHELVVALYIPTEAVLSERNGVERPGLAAEEQLARQLQVLHRRV